MHAEEEKFLSSSFESPLGRYILVSSAQGVVCLEPQENIGERFSQWERAGVTVEEGNGHNQQAAAELKAYFAGKLSVFSVPLDLRGTEFQLRVWRVLLNIPYGETRSYGQIAQELDPCSSSRAVGQANSRNPVSIIVPCHRVIGADGKMVGYGGGLDRKRALLNLEAKFQAKF